MTGQTRTTLAGRIQQAASRSSTGDETPAAAVTPRAKPVRLSVDLAPTSYRRLIDYCHKTAEDLGVARVTGVDVLRALLAELAEDQQLADRVRGRIRSG